MGRDEALRVSRMRAARFEANAKSFASWNMPHSGRRPPNRQADQRFLAGDSGVGHTPLIPAMHPPRANTSGGTGCLRGAGTGLDTHRRSSLNTPPVIRRRAR